MYFKNTRIQRKIMNVILLTCGIVLLFMCSVYIVFEFFSFRTAEKNKLSITGSIIASNSSAALAFESQKDAIEILSALKVDKHIEAAGLYDKNGNLFAYYSIDSSKSNFPLHPGKEGYLFDGSRLTGFEPVKQNGQVLGTLYLMQNLDAMYDQLEHYILIALLLIVVSLIVAAIISRLMQKTISEPILALEQTARIISEKRDYSVRAKKETNDEVGALTEAFNHMLAQIETQNIEITSFNQQLEKKVQQRTHALQEQKDFIETIINSSVDLVAVFDKDLKYIMLNKRADDYYEISRENIIGKNILEVFPQTKQSGMYDDLRKALNGNYIHNAKYTSIVTGRSFENFYIPLKDNQNDIYGVLTIGHDITNIVKANEKLETLNEELVKSNRDLEQFAYVASHDLQEPLRKIQTFTQLLGVSLKDEEKANRYQDKIKQAALRMQNLIQDVLNFSRISKMEEAFSNTDLNKILDNLKIDFELLIKEKQAVINHNSLPSVKGIPLQLSQLFSNIISNALKYNDKQPVIDITWKKLSHEETEKIHGLSNSVSYMQIEFTDNGIGFEPQFNEKIFSIFQRLHGKQEYSGTGIGLALCKKIVENHQGIIYAMGKPGKGATFTVILPG